MDRETLEQSLRVVENVYPNIRLKRQWAIYFSEGREQVVDMLRSKDFDNMYTVFNPHDPSIRGKYQLFDVINAINTKVGNFSIETVIDGDITRYVAKCTNTNNITTKSAKCGVVSMAVMELADVVL